MEFHGFLQPKLKFSISPPITSMKLSRTLLLTLPGLLFAGYSTSHAAVVQANGQFNGGGINHAYLKAASQTSTAFDGEAARAVDGNNSGAYGSNSITHTDDTGVDNSWEVNLGANTPVEQITIWNRTDCCPLRLSNYRLGVYDAGNVEIWAQNYYTNAGEAAGAVENVTLPAGVSGQIIRVSQLGPNSDGNRTLSLSEVQVLNLNPVLFPNVALNKPATQSSTAYGGDASRAVDGNLSGSFGDNSTTHTADAANGWTAGTPVFWEVDLQGDFSINEITVGGRTDCCGERFGNFRVSILDDGVEVWGMDNFTGAAGSGVSGPASGWTTYDDAGGFIGTGDKVRVTLIDGRNNSADPNNSGTMSLAEVQVFGQAVPEPGAMGLAALAGLALLRRRRRTA